MASRPYLRNILANWFGFIVNIVATLFLTPFVIRHLGMESYGVWILLVSLTGYLSLIELGVRPGVGRYVNYYLSLQQVEKVNGLLSTAFCFSMVTALPLCLASVILITNISAIFPKIPVSLIPSAQVALLLITLNVWLSFFAASFGSILVAFERFDFDCFLGMITLAVRIVAIVLVLDCGGGLLEIAWVEASTSILKIILLVGLSKHLFSELRIRPSLISRGHFKELMNYGAWAFISSMAMKLTYWFDSLLITWFLGPTHVAIYAVGSMVVSYGSALVDQCNMVFSPQIMSSCAKNDFFSVKDMFKKATLTIISAGTVIFLGFIVFGGEFISLWMGEDFNQGYTITVLLAISKMFDLPAIAGRPVFWGLNKMRYGAYLDLFQGVSTVVLAITFLVLFKMGIVGVALANLAPQLVVSISMGILACRWIDLPAVWLSKQVLLRWVALMAAFYLICICLMHLLPSSGWGWFVVKVAVAVGVYVPLVWAILLCRQDKIQLQAYIVGTFSSESPNATV